MKLEASGVIIYNIMKTVTVLEMQDLDRKTIEEVGIPSIVLMENAGRWVSEVAMDMLISLTRKKVAIFCGTGNNGGDGFVAARHLSSKGAEVDVRIVGRRSYIKNDPLINLKILDKMGISIKEIDSPLKVDSDIIIDAIFGIGLKGEVREPVKGIIASLNKETVPIIAVDVPSGLDGDTGEALGEAIRAKKTVTMQFPKKGFYLNKGPEYTGEVVVADIGMI